MEDDLKKNLKKKKEKKTTLKVKNEGNLEKFKE